MREVMFEFLIISNENIRLSIRFFVICKSLFFKFFYRFFMICLWVYKFCKFLNFIVEGGERIRI